MELSPVTERNATTMPAFSYYSTTLLGNVNNETVITGLLIGLVIGIAILVLFVGILLVVFLLDKFRPRNSPTLPTTIAQPQVADYAGNKPDPYMSATYEMSPRQQPTISVRPPSDIHPALRDVDPQESHPESTAQNVNQIPVPRSLTPGEWGKPPRPPPRAR
ncbi:hypothetical protein BKA67DRAFT_660085 [Truncatella angustata]|uniref:Uncharacterized protein n=1 Tax=Truncatella angustata TaxID=152316 RepID=A0A9P8UJY5_9PEZI|nr:uncharacterized protein BKA67DRAFT_660085 [Truncatella angustata]KAH6653474.1 hypothetical protein BKA67DRAFT_660085 [Truncatella angustata]